MNHVTVLKIMIEGTASFSYHTFCYPASFTVMGGSKPQVVIEGHGDRREDRIPITGDLLILNGDGAIIAQASYAELLANAVSPKASDHRHHGVNTNLGKTTYPGAGLTAVKVMEGWGADAGFHLFSLMKALVTKYGSNLNWVLGVTNQTDPDNKLQAIVYIPHADNLVQQVIGVVKEDMGVYLGALTTKVLGELNLGVDGSFHGNYGDLKYYRVVTQDDFTFVEIPTPTAFLE